MNGRPAWVGIALLALAIGCGGGAGSQVDAGEPGDAHGFDSASGDAAGPHDAGEGVDSSANDAAVEGDAPEADATVESDAIVEHDASTDDGGAPSDAGASEDGSATSDGGAPRDAGAPCGALGEACCPRGCNRGLSCGRGGVCTCGALGSGCGGDDDCCEGLSCLGGVCEACTLSAADSCTTGAPAPTCCGSSLVCGTREFGGPTSCCFEPTATTPVGCTADTECCGVLSFCDLGSCCQSGPCTTASECCDAQVCYLEGCRSPIGGPCRRYQDCHQAVCSSRGVCLCLTAGELCFPYPDACCAGLTCSPFSGECE